MSESKIKAHQNPGALPDPLGDAFDAALEALERMRRADLRGTGCHLTAAMISSLSLTQIGQMWLEPTP